MPAESPATCSQCGQRTPVCAECEDTIIFVPVAAPCATTVPKSGFGMQGRGVHRHMPRPKVFIT